jgi:arginine/lysine/ornithine decarboxylase
MFSPSLPENCFDNVYNALSKLKQKSPLIKNIPAPFFSESEMSIRQALMSPRKKVSIKQALDKILADANVSCPPAIPVAICGEKITKEHIDSFEYYGINEIFVVDNK